MKILIGDKYRDNNSRWSHMWSESSLQLSETVGSWQLTAGGCAAVIAAFTGTFIYGGRGTKSLEDKSTLYNLLG